MEESRSQTLDIEITQIIAIIGSHYHPNIWKNKERGWHYQYPETTVIHTVEARTMHSWLA